MTRKESTRIAHQESALNQLGITSDHAEKLRRISMTLQRWHELGCGIECGWYVERNEKTEKPHMCNGNTGYRSRQPIPDREKGAHRRLATIMASYPHLTAYVQTDPRGIALYILRPGDVPTGKDASCYYNRGIAVY